MAANQMLKSLLSSAQRSHLARTHLFITPRGTLKRNKFWTETMESDILVYDFQDGCSPKERGTVFKGLGRANLVYPNKDLTVRLTELERNDPTCNGNRIYDEIKASLEQKQVYWLMLPMCNDVQDVKEYIQIIDKLNPQWLKYHGSLQMICETPKCRHNLYDILGEVPEVQGVIVGGVDYLRFAQGTTEDLLGKLRWDVLNACLYHGRFAIDSPPMSLSSDDSTIQWHLQSAHSHGLRSGVILHPQQSATFNHQFTPRLEDVQAAEDLVHTWLSTRDTGYLRGSGNDFYGPPHMKKQVWIARYYSEIQAKKIVHTQIINENQIQNMNKQLDSMFKEMKATEIEEADKNDIHDIDIDDNENENALNRNRIGFIAFALSCHPRVKDRLSTLGFSNVQYYVSPEDNVDVDHQNRASSSTSTGTIEDIDCVSSQIINRRVTSKGDLVVTYNVEVLDQNHNPLCRLIRHDLEHKLEYINYDNEGDYTNTCSPHSHESNTSISSLSLNKMDKNIDMNIDEMKIQSFIEDGTYIELSKDEFVSPSVIDTFTCSSYQSPEMETELEVEVETSSSMQVPPSLHLFYHCFMSMSISDLNEHENENIEVKVDDAMFHGQMMSSTKLVRNIYQLSKADNRNLKSGQKSYMSTIHDKDDDVLLSTVFFSRYY